MASMGGRVQRIAGFAAAAARTRTVHIDDICGLDGRLLGQRVEQQHVLPENEGSTQTVPDAIVASSQKNRSAQGCLTARLSDKGNKREAGRPRCWRLRGTMRTIGIASRPLLVRITRSSGQPVGLGIVDRGKHVAFRLHRAEMLADGFRITVPGKPAIDRSAGRKLSDKVRSIFLCHQPLAKRQRGFVNVGQFRVLRIVRLPSHQTDVLAMFLRIRRQCA